MLYYRLKKEHWFSKLPNAIFENKETDEGNTIKFHNSFEDSRSCLMTFFVSEGQKFSSMEFECVKNSICVITQGP